MKKNKLLKYIFIFVSLIFICSYIVSKSGYYEYSLHNQKELTDMEIKKFEDEVKNGNYVDINDYLKERKKDYTSPLTRITVRTSKKINDYLKSGLESMLNVLQKLLDE